MSFPLAPNPITWTSEEAITSTALRADPANLAWLLTKRPLLIAAQISTAQTIPATTNTDVVLDTEYNDTWSGHFIGSALYTAQLPGWYLCDASIAIGGTDQTGINAAGINAVQNSVSTFHLGNATVSDGTNFSAPNVSDLVQLDPATNDTVAASIFQSTGSTQTLGQSFVTFEWVALPTSVGTPRGVVVSSPHPAALWPPGTGTTITNAGGIAAAATSLTVGSATGMIVGGTLGLDYYQGTAAASTAEAVTITSVSGLTIGIGATVYAHAHNAHVAVPVASAWMNQQVRDIINFLAYPPVARLYYVAGSQSLTSQTFPAGTAITFTNSTVDNFSGWNASVKSQYVFPVSGVYYVYGQVWLAACTTNNLAAGLAVTGGTVQWGDSIRTSSTSLAICATVRKHLRVSAGDYVQLFGSQHSGSTQNLTGTASDTCAMIVVFRGF